MSSWSTNNNIKHAKLKDNEFYIYTFLSYDLAKFIHYDVSEDNHQERMVCIRRGITLFHKKLIESTLSLILAFLTLSN
jgi:hypothetical protein